jgi:WD40 repeat protein
MIFSPTNHIPIVSQPYLIKSVVIADPSVREFAPAFVREHFTAVWSPNGSNIAVGYGERISIYDHDLSLLQEIQVGCCIRSISWCNNDLIAMVFWNENYITLLDVSQGINVGVLRGHNAYVHAIDRSPDGSKLASKSTVFTIKIWDLFSLQEVRTISAWNASGRNTQAWVSVAWNPDGTQIASPSSNNIKIWNFSSGEELSNSLWLSESGSLTDLDWHPHSNEIAYASRLSPNTGIWDQLIQNESTWIKGHNSDVFSVAWNHDGSKLASASKDTTIKIWEYNSTEELITFSDHSDYVMHVAWHPHNDKLLSTSLDGTVKLWSGNIRLLDRIFNSNRELIGPGLGLLGTVLIIQGMAPVYLQVKHYRKKQSEKKSILYPDDKINL